MPSRSVAWTYADLDARARRLASGLQDSGYGLRSVAISDESNSPEDTLLLQLAAAHLGAAVATPPAGEDALRSFSAKYDVRGSVCGEQIADLVARCTPWEHDPEANEQMCAGIFGGAAITHDTVMRLGRSSRAKLQMTSADVVCCASTLLHSFGIGSAVASTLSAGACVVLPAAAETSTAAGCGAGATLDVLADTRSTLLFTDTSTLEAMRGVEEPAALALRGGVIKVSSGADFLTNVMDVPVEDGIRVPISRGASLPLELGGVPFVAMGRHAFWVGSAPRMHQVSSTSSVI